MASYSSAWIVGSVKGLAYYFTVDAAVQTVTGDRYLYHSTGSLSILDALRAGMVAAGYAGASAVLTRDRRVKLSSGAGNFAITWDSTGLRDLLGWTADLSGAASYTAPNPSALLWSPAKPLRPELAPRGTLGIPRPLSYFTTSSDGSTFVVSHGERIDQRFTCGMVAVDRVYTSSLVGGEWARLFRDSLAKGYSFYVYPEVVEDPGSSTTATLSDGLGPYAFSPSGRAPSWSYVRSRGMEWCDKRADVDFACRVVPEYS